MMTPRWVAHFLARLLGYFWLPCPRCGRMFAGFEWGGGGIGNRMTCRYCDEDDWTEVG